MLQVSDTAAMAFKTFLDADEGSASAIRLELVPTAGDDSSASIRFAAVEVPTEGDQRADTTIVDVYVAPELTEPLADALLDAEVTPEGAELVIRPREGEERGGQAGQQPGQQSGQQPGQQSGQQPGERE
jgi:Fe-S cluster assembly iron-binding protein IscA